MPKKKFLNSLKFSKFQRVREKKKLLTIKKCLKNRVYNYRKSLSEIIDKNQKKLYVISVSFKANNIFCSVGNFTNSSTLYVTSSGKYKIKVSKKILKHNYKLILERFLKIIKKNIKRSNVIIKLVVPVLFRKKVMDIFKKNLEFKKLLVVLKERKSYNGCRPVKKKRKKRVGFRLLK